MVLDVVDGHVIQFLVAADSFLKGGDFGVFFVLIRLLHVIQGFLLRIDSIIILVVGQLLLELRHLFLQLDFLRLCVPAVIQRKCVDAFLELRNLLHLLGDFILVVSLLLGGIQRLLTEVNDIAIGVFEVFQCVNLLLNSVLQHIHDVLEDVVDAGLHILQLFL